MKKKKESSTGKEVSGKAKKEKNAEKKKVEGVVKEIEKALFSVKFYPVAVDEEAKNQAFEKLKGIYSKGNETVKQLLLYMVHNQIAKASEMKVMHTYDYFKTKKPDGDPAQLRMEVYRSMFNYNTSLEGVTELIGFLGKLNGSDDAAKLLTYHFARVCTIESEGNRMLRAAIIDALGESESHYALKALLDYAKYNDNESTINRLVNALIVWEEKIDGLGISKSEKKKLVEKMKEYITKEGRASHYG